LAEEESVRSETRDGGNCTSKPVCEGTNDRDMRQVGAEELAGNREDKAGLNQRRRGKRRVCEEIWKGQSRVSDWSNRGLNAVAGKIYPFQKMRDFVSANAEGDLENLWMFSLLAHRRIKARAALLYISKVKCCSIRNYLDMVGVVEVGIGDGNGGSVGDLDRLRKGSAEVGISSASVPDEPTGIDVEMHEIREAADVLSSGRCAAGEDAEFVEVNWFCAL